MSTVASMETAYDYVIIGGGTAGLVLANRLSENSDVTVAVLEAGGNTTADPKIAVPALFTSALASELDWNIPSVPQAGLDGRRIGHNQGKALGGSSAINAQALIPFSATDIDTWESLVGDKGWNFATLSPYLKKAFGLTLPEAAAVTQFNVSWAAP
ncbi:GMC oxidoreductase, partial [Periconia macrospinosa]